MTTSETSMRQAIAIWPTVSQVAEPVLGIMRSR
jgi:hypothetical protein